MRGKTDYGIMVFADKVGGRAPLARSGGVRGDAYQIEVRTAVSVLFVGLGLNDTLRIFPFEALFLYPISFAAASLFFFASHRSQTMM